MRLEPIPAEVVRFGTELALFRWWMSRIQERAESTKSGDPSGGLDDGGSIAEAWFYWTYARGKRRDWVWTLMGGTKQIRDIGPCEVQAAVAPNENLIIREYDSRVGVPLETPYILVQLKNVGADRWLGRICGYVTLGEGLEHADHWAMPTARPGEGVWLLKPDSLHDMPLVDAGANGGEQHG